MTDENSWIFDHLLATPQADVRTWLQRPPESWNLGELSWRDSVELVNKLLSLGATEVVAAEVMDEPSLGFVTSNHLVVTLPVEAADRAALFRFERRHSEAMGFDGCPDCGQRYLYFKIK